MAFSRSICLARGIPCSSAGGTSLSLWHLWNPSPIQQSVGNVRTALADASSPIWFPAHPSPLCLLLLSFLLWQHFSPLPAFVQALNPLLLLFTTPPWSSLTISLIANAVPMSCWLFNNALLLSGWGRRAQLQWPKLEVSPTDLGLLWCKRKFVAQQQIVNFFDVFLLFWFDIHCVPFYVQKEPNQELTLLCLTPNFCLSTPWCCVREWYFW